MWIHRESNVTQTGVLFQRVYNILRRRLYRYINFPCISVWSLYLIWFSPVHACVYGLNRQTTPHSKCQIALCVCLCVRLGVFVLLSGAHTVEIIVAIESEWVVLFWHCVIVCLRIFSFYIYLLYSHNNIDDEKIVEIIGIHSKYFWHYCAVLRYRWTRSVVKVN